MCARDRPERGREIHVDTDDRGAAPPPLILRDAPTNQLDIAAAEAVEAALAEYDGALFVVSHDDGFAATLGLTRELAIDRRGLRDRMLLMT